MNAYGTLCINGVFQFLLLIFRNVYIHIGITHLYYVIKFLSSDICLLGFLHEDSIAFRFGLWQLFLFYWFYLKSLEDTQGFSDFQRFYIQAKRLERKCKLCFAFSHSHKTHQSHPHSRELNLLIRCWQHFAIRECPLCKPDSKSKNAWNWISRSKINLKVVWNFHDAFQNVGVCWNLHSIIVMPISFHHNFYCFWNINEIVIAFWNLYFNLWGICPLPLPRLNGNLCLMAWRWLEVDVVPFCSVILSRDATLNCPVDFCYSLLFIFSLLVLFRCVEVQLINLALNASIGLLL